jgi:hypothetical protein
MPDNSDMLEPSSLPRGTAKNDPENLFKIAQTVIQYFFLQQTQELNLKLSESNELKLNHNEKKKYDCNLFYFAIFYCTIIYI